MSRYQITLISDKLPMSSKALKQWCENMQRQFNWSTDFEELKHGCDRKLIAVDKTTQTSITVRKLQ